MAAAPAAAALDRLETRLERIRVTARFTYAFHAREVRFEVDRGEGFSRAFPETFSFHVERHDPTELALQLEDLWTRPRLIAENATRRDSETLVRRLLSGLPGYLERVVDRIDEAPGTSPATRARVAEDVAALCLVALRFLADKGLEDAERLRLPAFHLRKLLLRAFQDLLAARVRPESLDRYRAGHLERLRPGEEANETTLMRALAGGDVEAVERQVLVLAERAFHGWLEDVCLDESNRAFEGEDSPFDDRESEVLRACAATDAASLVRGRDLSPFLRRPRNRDALRLLDKVKLYFLRQYDVYHSALLIQHTAWQAAGRDDADRVLSRHTARNYFFALVVLVSPFLGAALAYDRAPEFFDLVAAGEMVLVTGVAFWFLVWRFAARRDLTPFYAGVPRIGAGIIVGYLPVFLIDEVWALALQAHRALGAVMVLLALTTLLYLYVEVQRRLGEGPVAFARARALFLLGLLQAFVFGLISTGLIGKFMAARTFDAADVPFDVFRAQIPRFAGELPRVLGIEPFYAFPTVVILMTFLSIFIGTFLQLLWEDLPITEPL